MKLKNTFLTGLVLWLPILATYAVINFILSGVDSLIAMLPPMYQPDQLLGYHLPGLNLFLIILIILLSGLLAANFLGRYVVKFGEKLLSHIPLVRSVYSGVKDALTSIVKTDSKSFHKVVMIEYPRKGIWSIAFITNEHFKSPMKDQIKNKDLLLAFVPTTPNPTSGFLVAVDSKECVELNIKVDDALKLVISLGTVCPMTTVDGA